MRIVVTGGAGFIGSHLVDRLVGLGHDVVVVDTKPPTGAATNLDEALATGRCQVVRADVAAEAGVAVIAAYRPELLFHLAAQVGVPESIADPVGDATVNIVGTINVLEAARAASTRKVVFASSVAVYGPPARLPVTEQDRIGPVSPYGASKFSAETYVRQYHDLYGLDTTILALSNAYGPRQAANGESGVVAIFTQAMLDGRPTTLFGDGGNTRDYVYVSDVVDAFIAAGTTPAGDGSRFNIGTGIPTTDRELHVLLSHLTGSRTAALWQPPRPSGLRHMVVECSAAHDRLGWRPRTTLIDGLFETVAWVRDRLGSTPSGVGTEAGVATAG